MACRHKKNETELVNLGSLVVYRVVAWWKDAFTCLKVLAYCYTAITASINLFTLPKKLYVINLFGNLPYLIQPPVISSFIP